jgi:hypothetical protein
MLVGKIGNLRDGKFRRIARLLPGVLMLAVTVAPARAANMRNFIEAVRRKASVVYIGTVKEVQFLERTKFDVKARAVVTISAIARGPEKGPAEAILDYSSYDDKTPMLAGGPQYQLQPGAMVIVFTDSFRSHIPSGYLVHGPREEVLQRVTALRDQLREMSADEMKRNEIGEEDRKAQLALYEKLRGHLSSRR